MIKVIEKFKKAKSHNKNQHIIDFKDNIKSTFCDELLQLYNEAEEKGNIENAWHELDIENSCLLETAPKYAVLIRTIDYGELGECKQLYNIGYLKDCVPVVRENEVLL